MVVEVCADVVLVELVLVEPVGEVVTVSPDPQDASMITQTANAKGSFIR